MIMRTTQILLMGALIFILTGAKYGPECPFQCWNEGNNQACGAYDEQRPNASGPLVSCDVYEVTGNPTVCGGQESCIKCNIGICPGGGGGSELALSPSGTIVASGGLVLAAGRDAWIVPCSGGAVVHLTGRVSAHLHVTL